MKCDPMFWVDQGLLHMNILVLNDSTIQIVLLTPNRNIVETYQCTSDSEVSSILNCVIERQDLPCHGFESQDHIYNQILQRVRKSDIDGTLIEKFNGKIIFRSRSCQYTYQATEVNQEHLIQRHDSFEPKQCKKCREYIIELDDKYFGGVILATKPINPNAIPKIEPTDTLRDIAADNTDDFESSKRKRGRPKGSKNKNYYSTLEMLTASEESKTAGLLGERLKHENDENNPDVDNERILVHPNPDYIYGNEDIAMEDDPLDTDYQQLKRGLRKRITTKRQKALLETKRKRGRPPIKVGPIDCPDCGKAFETAKDYRKHCVEHTNSFACTEGECVKRFKSQKELDIHLRKHKGEKPYVCSECDKAYTLRQDLRLHMRKHTGARPFKCDSCPKAFARAHQLAVHQPVHTGERAHLCSECGNAFSSVSSLIDHRKRSHLKLRDHKCLECVKEFFTKTELAAHVRTHTGDKPFQCGSCGKAFARQHHLKRHIAGVHNGEKSKTKHMSIIKDDTPYATTDTVLFTTDEMGETVLIKQVDYPSYVIQTTTNTKGALDKEQPQFAASSLLELSQHVKDDPEGATAGTAVVVDAGGVVEIPGHEGGYILVTTSDDEQKLVPISQSQLSQFSISAAVHQDP